MATSIMPIKFAVFSRVRFDMSRAIAEVLVESACISCATTPNAAPKVPARAASMRALRAKTLVSELTP